MSALLLLNHSIYQPWFCLLNVSFASDYSFYMSTLLLLTQYVSLVSAYPVNMSSLLQLTQSICQPCYSLLTQYQPCYRLLSQYVSLASAYSILNLATGYSVNMSALLHFTQSICQFCYSLLSQNVRIARVYTVNILALLRLNRNISLATVY